MTKKLKDLLSALVSWFVAGWVFVCTRDLKSGTSGLIRPEFIPRVVAIILFVLGAMMFINGIRSKVSEDEKKTIQEKKSAMKAEPFWERFTPTITLLLILLFLLSMKSVGITISATVYLTLQMTLLSGDFSLKSWLKYFLISVVTSLAVLFIFRYGFLLKLPVNKWGF